MRKYDKEILKYKKIFKKIYEKDLISIIKDLEFQRMTSLVSLFVIEVILAVIAFYVYIYFGNNESLDPDYKYFFYVMICGLADMVLIVFLPVWFNRAFSLRVKHCCMERLLSAFENIKWYNKKNIISDNELEKSQLFAFYNTRISDDEFEGSYKNIHFRISETHLIMKEGAWYSKHRRRINIFKGIIVSFNISKRVNNLTLIASKYDTKIANRCVSGGAIVILFSVLWDLSFKHGQIPYEYAIAAFFAGAVIILSAGKIIDVYNARKHEKLNEVKLEDVEFHKKYRAYSSDQIEARYLITTSFMERFKGIQTAFGTENVKCSFYDGNKLMFAVSTNKNAFEIGDLFHCMNKSDQMKTFFDELASIYALIDYFKLDEKTGL